MLIAGLKEKLRAEGRPRADRGPQGAGESEEGFRITQVQHADTCRTCHQSVALTITLLSPHLTFRRRTSPHLTSCVVTCVDRAEYVEYAAQQRGTALHPAATAAAEAHESGVSLEAAALLREAAAVLDCIASE